MASISCDSWRYQQHAWKSKGCEVTDRPHSRDADLERVKVLLKELTPDAEPFDRLKVLFAVIDYGTTCALEQWKRDTAGTQTAPSAG